MAKRLDPTKYDRVFEMVWNQFRAHVDTGDIPASEVADAESRLRTFEASVDGVNLTVDAAVSLLYRGNRATTVGDERAKTTTSNGAEAVARPPLPGGTVSNLFSAPVEVTNVVSGAAESSSFCKALAQFAISDFARFEAKTESSATGNAIHDHFKAQMRAYNGIGRVDAFKAGTTNKKLATTDEYQTLKYYIDAAVTRYAKNHGVRVPHSSYREMMGWLAVYRNNSSHESHHHEDASLSVVFYAAVPEGSGALTFEDPRGTNAFLTARAGSTDDVLANNAINVPFYGNKVRMHPKVGDIVVFPGWLSHKVGVTTHRVAGAHRVSYAFNVRGYWQDTLPLS